MALDPIVIGCDWSAVILVVPTDGRTEADVTTDLTGSSVAAILRDAAGTSVAVGSGSVLSAAERKITLALSSSASGVLSPTESCAWDVRVTNGSRILPVTVFDRVDVQASPV